MPKVTTLKEWKFTLLHWVHLESSRGIFRGGDTGGAVAPPKANLTKMRKMKVTTITKSRKLTKMTTIQLITNGSKLMSF